MRKRTGHSIAASGSEVGRQAIRSPGATDHARRGWGSVSGYLRTFVATALVVMLMALNALAADFVIVVDVSGSMAETVARKDSRVRIDVVQKALEEYLPALPVGSRVNLIAFNKGIVTEKEIRLNGPAEYSEALAWTSELSTYIHRSAPTYLWTTLRHALKTASRYSEEKPDQPVTVRVLTDGADNERGTGLSLDLVLQEFLPVLDGERIRSNLVLLGDLEFKTKLTLPEGAFEMTRNTAWEVIFPPVVLWAPTEPTVGDEVRLFENNTRSVYKEYLWQVDGVTVGQEKVLTWRFTEPRIHRVTLKVTGLQGTQNSATVFVRVNDEVLTARIKGPAEIIAGRPVQFASEIAGTCASVEWRFGDGTTSVERNPQHTFQIKESEQKAYSVTLRAVSPLGKVVMANPHTIRVSAEKKAPAPQAAFRVLTQNLRAGDPIQLVNETTGVVETVHWDVDGESKGSSRNPEFVIGTPGEKTIRMTVRGPGGESVATRKIMVQPRFTQPSVWCGASKLDGKPPLTVQFTNRITGDYQSLLWNFGDGHTSTNENPSHTFGSVKNYTVTLTVTPMDSSQSVVSKQLTIKVNKPWPMWAKAAAVGVPCLVLLGWVAGVVYLRRRKALRLPVYYFAEQAPMCKTAVLTESGQLLSLTPAASLRLRREGKTRNLIAEPLANATLLNADGQERAVIPVGDGVRVTVRDAAGQASAVAISTRQKPSRPAPAALTEQTPFEDVTVCGVHNGVGDNPSSDEPDDFDWGWNKAVSQTN